MVCRKFIFAILLLCLFAIPLNVFPTQTRGIKPTTLDPHDLPPEN